MKNDLVTKQYVSEKCTIALQHCVQLQNTSFRRKSSSLASELYGTNGSYRSWI